MFIGADACTRDMQWEYYKRILLNEINKLVNDLKLHGHRRCGIPVPMVDALLLTALTGYIEVFPNNNPLTVPVISNFFPLIPPALHKLLPILLLPVNCAHLQRHDYWIK